MRQIFFFIALALVGFGVFLKVFYDVPDAQETVNFFTSWFFIIVGAASALIVLFWSRPRKPK